MAASLLLHVGIGLVFALKPFIVAPEQPLATEPAVLRVSLATRNPQREVSAPRVQQESTVSSAQTAGLPQEESGPTPAEPTADPALIPVIADEPDAVGRVPPSMQLSGNPAPVSGEAVADEAPTPVLDAAQVQASMAAYMSSYRGGLVQGWMEACRQPPVYKNGEQVCPDEGVVATTANAERTALLEPLFVNHATQRASNERHRRQLVEESRYLEALVGDDTVLGEIARERYAVVRSDYCQVAACGPAGFSVPTAGVVELVGFGGSQLVLLQGLVTLDINEQFGLLASALKGPEETDDGEVAVETIVAGEE